MPFKESGTYPLSDKDVVSFAFDDPAYDLDKPVSLGPNVLSCPSLRLHRQKPDTSRAGGNALYLPTMTSLTTI